MSSSPPVALAHPPTTPPRSEQHPADWWAAFEAAAGEAGVFGAHRPAAIAVAGQQHGLVALDAVGRRAAPGQALERHRVGRATRPRSSTRSVPAAWAEACGSVPVASFTITKLRWLRRERARGVPTARTRAAAARLAHLPAHRWLHHGPRRRVGHRLVVAGRGAYRPDLLALVDDAVDWEPRLPAGPRARPTLAGEWAATSALVAPGTGDNMAAALGLGLRAGDLALSLGTSGTAFTVSDDADCRRHRHGRRLRRCHRPVPARSCAPSTPPRSPMPSPASSVSPPPSSTPSRSRRRPGAGGLVLVPHLDGERTPNRPDATGLLAGIRSDVTREQLARAAVEGVVCNLLAGADHLPAGDGRVAPRRRRRPERRLPAGRRRPPGPPRPRPRADELVALRGGGPGGGRGNRRRLRRGRRCVEPG